MSIDAFKAAVSNFARPTLYKVSAESILDRNLEYLAKASQLPSSNVGLIEVPYMGRKVKIAGDRTFDDWTLTIQNDESMLIRKQFEDWSNLINDHIQNVGPNNIAAYKHDMTVQQLGNDGGVLAEYRLVGCWPQVIAEVDLGFENNDTISEFTVTISYDYWTRIA